MSRMWVMVETERQCAACGAWIPPRTWFLELTLPRTIEPVLRCEACAAVDGSTPPVEGWPTETDDVEEAD